MNLSEFTLKAQRIGNSGPRRRWYCTKKRYDYIQECNEQYKNDKRERLADIKQQQDEIKVKMNEGYTRAEINVDLKFKSIFDLYMYIVDRILNHINKLQLIYNKNMKWSSKSLIKHNCDKSMMIEYSKHKIVKYRTRYRKIYQAKDMVHYQRSYI